MKPTPTTILDPAQYEKYAAAWDALISSGTGEALQQAFEAPGGARRTFGRFSIEQLLELVSTVGARLIKARFLLAPDASGQARFAVVLFAADASGTQLSAYYLAAPASAPGAVWAAPRPPAAPPTRLTGQMPAELVLRWLTAWTKISQLTPSLFTMPGQLPLRGYNFALDDFMNPLFAAQPFADKSLLLHFGLHTYAAAGATVGAAPTQTFGLVLCVAAVEDDGSLRDEEGDGSFYNAGLASPPNP